MPALTVNFAIEQGSDFKISYQYLDDNNNGVDLTGKCILLRYRTDANLVDFFNSAENPTLLNEKYTLTGDSNGIITLTLSSEMTKDFTFNTAIYDLDVIEKTNMPKNTRLVTGQFSIIKRNFSVVTDCETYSAAQDGNIDETPTVSVPVPVSPTPIPFVDLCLPDDCMSMDIYSRVYTGSGIALNDMQNNSGVINVPNTGIITNVEIALNGLRHNSPQDLTAILTPPSGNSVLLFANQKISNYSNGFSFMLSNKAPAEAYLNNIANGGLSNILDKTNTTKFNNLTLVPSFSHLFNSSPSGNWRLFVNDNDIGTSGSIDSWKLILTYQDI
jgi:subtilisin-like proprotein convertase family protein